MSAETVERPARPTPSLLASFAADAIEGGLHTVVRRAVKSVRRAVETLEDVKDDGVHYVKHQPLKTLGIAAGVGLIVGLAAGWIAGRSGSASATTGQTVS
jgi:hypothetical protein